MGHSIITCSNCGADIMEGHNDWHCDMCSWFTSPSTSPGTEKWVREMRWLPDSKRIVPLLLGPVPKYKIFPGWRGQMYIAKDNRKFHLYDDEDLKSIIVQEEHEIPQVDTFVAMMDFTRHLNMFFSKTIGANKYVLILRDVEIRKLE